jgi:cytochrome oxidase assembly protein ShyY1
VRSLSFLISRRWVVFAIVVGLLAYLAWWLGEWQFHRLTEREHRNATIERNIEGPPASLGDVFATDRALPEGEEWHRVTATGTYDADNTLQIRYRTYEGNSGVEVVVPLTTASGSVLLVDRGWLATDAATTAADDVPAPPAGEVVVTGWARRDAGESATVTTEDGVLSARAISSRMFAETTGQSAYQGFLQLESETPEPTTKLRGGELPDLGNGPHFFYGLQWWFFGLLAIFGFGYLAFDEWRVLTGRRPPRDQRVSRRADTSVDTSSE